MRRDIENDFIDVVEEAATAESGLALVKKHRPDVVILDYYLPDMCGMIVLEKIIKISSVTKVIFSTAISDLMLLKHLFESKAAGLITKGSRYPYVDAIQAVMSGTKYLQPDIAHELLSYKENNRFLASLTSRDLEILIMCAKGTPQKTVASTFNLSVKTVSNIRHNISKKCGFQNMSQLDHTLLRYIEDSQFI